MLSKQEEALRIALALIAAALAAPALAASTPTLVINRVKNIPLRHVVDIPWQGEHMKSQTMSVYCADGGFVFGLFGQDVVGLNGYSAGFRDGGKVLLGSGALRPITTTDKRDLVAIGVITASAEPLVYNTVAGEGLQAGRKACP